MPAVRILSCGEQAMVVEFGSRPSTPKTGALGTPEIDPALNARVHRLARVLTTTMPERIVEVVPTYRSLMIYFDPLVISRKTLQQEIARLLPELERTATAAEMSKVITIPAIYGGEFGPDLGDVARHNGISERDIVAIHTSRPLLIYMLGFTPGFPYIGGISERIAAPRLDVPRMKVPAGSVAIAGTQTGIYPMESPGGWRLIGRTPLKVFDPSRERPFLLSAGDYVQFTAIQADEFHALEQQLARGDYSPKVRYVNIAGGGSCAR